MREKSTMVELVEELQKLPPTDKINFMIEEAKRGEYHDYKNEKYVCGKVALCSLLEDAGLYALSARVKDGEFDESPDEQDKLMMEKDFPGLFKRK